MNSDAAAANIDKRPRLTAAAPQLVVPDVVATAEYYRDRLGFEILGYFGEPSSPVFAIVRRDDVEIHLGRSGSCGVDGGDDEQQRRTNPNRAVRPEGVDVFIWVTGGVDALAEDLRCRGAAIVEGPVDRIYRVRELVVDDDNSYRLVFGQSLT